MNITLTNSTEGWYISTSQVFVVSLHVFHFLVGLPLNVYIITLLCTGNEGIEVADVFTLNQAIAEITYILFGLFHGLCSVNFELCFLKPMGFIFGISMCSRALFQCFVCLERYVAVVHPLTFLRLKPIRYRIECCIFSWTAALAFAINCMLTFPFLQYTFYAFVYAGILVLNIFCCMSILKKLRHPGPGDNEGVAREMNSFKKKAFQVVCMNLLAFLIQNFPITISFGIQNNLTLNEFNLAAAISHTISITMGFVQPIFVLHKAGKLSLIRSIPSGKN